MKLAISNLAWQPTVDHAVAAMMRASGFGGVELAPTKYWSQPLDATRAQIEEVRKLWEGEGLPIVALQSLLFNTRGLLLFESPEQRTAMSRYLAGIIRLGGRLGARAIVFGSPKNRRRGGMSHEHATEIAVPVFRELGTVAAEEGTCLCIEPNPAVYGCDWIITPDEALELVTAVDSPGFGLHLDAAGMTLAGVDVAQAIAACAGRIQHFHASEPQLSPIQAGGTVDHAAAAGGLVAQGYPNWVSIEMLEPPGGRAAIDAALRRVADIYG